MDASLIPTQATITAWLGGIVSAAAAVMALRRSSSKDARDRTRDARDQAKDAAEINYFASAMDEMRAAMNEMRIERDSWRKQFLESSALLAKANETIARMMALHEAREADVSELRTLNQHLRDLVVRLAPKELSDLLAEGLIPSKPKA